MSDAATWTETNATQLTQARRRGRLADVVFWQVALVSCAAYFSQTLIFDEANWYKIDLWDAFTWGLVVTQVFGLAIYVSRNRIQTVKSSLKIFQAIGGLSAGLTVAAITFLIADALRHNRDVLPLLGIAPGYCVAVFVFLVSMFLQLRLAIICLQALRPLFGRNRSAELTQDESIAHELTDSNTESNEKYSIADIFAFTGLAAVSITAYRLVLSMVTDRDSLRFLTIFYAASITAFCVYGLMQWRCGRWSKLLFITAVVVAIGYTEFNVATQLRSPLLRFGLIGIVLCNCFIAIATTMQFWLLDRLVARTTS